MTASTEVAAAPAAQSGKSCPNSKEASPVRTRSPAQVQEEANSLLATGKRHLLVGDVPSAVSSLAKGCELLSGAQRGGTPSGSRCVAGSAAPGDLSEPE